MIKCQQCGALLPSATSDCQECGLHYDFESAEYEPVQPELEVIPPPKSYGIAWSGIADSVLVIAAMFAVLQSVLLIFICGVYTFQFAVLGEWMLAVAIAGGGIINSVLSFAMYIVFMRVQKP